jgi:hypothetical protein
MHNRPLGLQTLRSATREELEAIYRDMPPVDWTPALWRGHFLCMLESAGARNLALRWISEIGFGNAPFWLDADEGLWCFGTPEIGIGRFVPRRGRSRWRDTTTLCLEYHQSKLPGLIRRELYDEVKPLTPDLALGISGINAGAGAGELFFFALTREPA